MAAKQLHIAMPSSNQPPMREWANAYWYVLRTGALQAKESLTDAEVADFIVWVKAFAVVTPCPDCRAHFASDWERYPFTAEHARDPFKAMSWVEDLRARIETRKKTAAAHASATSASASASASVPAVRQRPPANQARQQPLPAARGGVTAMHHRLALKSTLQQTAGNLRAPAGCLKCGKARKEKPVV